MDAAADSSGETVYDPTLDVYWLADANFPISVAGMAIRAAGNVAGIAPDGTMSYGTAIAWVNALNSYPQKGCPSGQTGYSCHNDWQLPATPPMDSSCTVRTGAGGNSFGPNCKGSALGSLFYVLLGLSYPATVAPPAATVGPFKNLGAGLYWTSDTNAGGQQTFSFLSNAKFANTTNYNLLRVLPMSLGAIGGTPPTGSAVVRPYVSGPAAGLAVYDSVTGSSWALDANLAASEVFGVTADTTVPASGNANAITMPLRDADGSIFFGAIPSWLNGMNAGSGYAGSNGWKLPGIADVSALFTNAGMKADDGTLLFKGKTGPFANFQAYFYWACPIKAGTKLCDYSANAGLNSGGGVMQWAFNFDTGFQGTDMAVKQFFTLVYRAKH